MLGHETGRKSSQVGEERSKAGGRKESMRVGSLTRQNARACAKLQTSPACIPLRLSPMATCIAFFSFPSGSFANFVFSHIY